MPRLRVQVHVCTKGKRVYEDAPAIRSEKTSHTYREYLTLLSESIVLVAMATLDFLMHKGPPNGDVDGGLEQLRYAVLTDGIPSNSDGMVSYPVRLICKLFC